MVGGGNRDRIHILPFQDVAKVLVGRGGLTHLLLRRVRELLKNIAVNVADVRDPCSIFIRLESGKMSIGAAIETNDCKVDSVVRAHDLTVALRRRSNS